MSQLTDLLKLSYVPRWTIVPMMRQQSVAEHSFRVAVIANLIWCKCLDAGEVRLGNIQQGDLLWWALNHDGEEATTGDIPSTAKESMAFNQGAIPGWYTGLSESQSSAIRQLVKLADTIEAYTWHLSWSHGVLFGRYDVSQYLARKLDQDVLALDPSGEWLQGLVEEVINEATNI